MLVIVSWRSATGTSYTYVAIATYLAAYQVNLARARFHVNTFLYIVPYIVAIYNQRDNHRYSKALFEL